MAEHRLIIGGDTSAYKWLALARKLVRQLRAEATSSGITTRTVIPSIGVTIKVKANARDAWIRIESKVGNINYFMYIPDPDGLDFFNIYVGMLPRDIVAGVIDTKLVYKNPVVPGTTALNAYPVKGFNMGAFTRMFINFVGGTLTVARGMNRDMAQSMVEESTMAYPSGTFFLVLVYKDRYNVVQLSGTDFLLNLREFQFDGTEGAMVQFTIPNPTDYHTTFVMQGINGDFFVITATWVTEGGGQHVRLYMTKRNTVNPDLDLVIYDVMDLGVLISPPRGNLSLEGPYEVNQYGGYVFLSYKWNDFETLVEGATTQTVAFHYDIYVFNESSGALLNTQPSTSIRTLLFSKAVNLVFGLHTIVYDLTAPYHIGGIVSRSVAHLTWSLDEYSLDVVSGVPSLNFSSNLLGGTDVYYAPAGTETFWTVNDDYVDNFIRTL